MSKILDYFTHKAQKKVKQVDRKNQNEISPEGQTKKKNFKKSPKKNAPAKRCHKQSQAAKFIIINSEQIDSHNAKEVYKRARRLDRKSGG